MAASRRAKRKSMKKRKILYTLLFISMFLLSGVIVFAITLSFETKNATSKMYKPLKRDEEQNSKELNNPKEDNNAFTILLAGIEHTKNEKYGRSDMLIVATINPKIGKISMVNIPRDTKLYIEDLGKEDKINHAYSTGGMDYTINTVEDFLDIPIDYYVSTDFQGFEDIVDTLGGVDVDVPFTFKGQLTDTLKWKTYTEGPMHLNGNEALAYVRMRKKDPEGDKGRNARQKQVILEILDKSTSFSTITKVDDMIKDVGNNVKTNIPTSEYLGFIKMYQEIRTSPIEQLQLEGYDEKVGEYWYFFPNDNSLKELQDKLKNNLDNIVQEETSEIIE